MICGSRCLPHVPPRVLPKFVDPESRPKAILNLTIEARKCSGIAINALKEIARNGHSDSSRIAASIALLDRGFGRPAQSVELNLTADAVSKRLSELSNAELVALEARMIAIPAALALEEPAVDADADNAECEQSDYESDEAGLRR
jgi:hypothetical protein